LPRFVCLPSNASETIQRYDELDRAGQQGAGPTRASAAGHPSRRAGRIALHATDPGLLDTAEALGRTVERPCSRPSSPRSRSSRTGAPPPCCTRRCAARCRTTALRRWTTSQSAALSGADELHPRGLAPVTALALALKGVGGAQPVSPQELRDRVRARFPALAALPDRPRLDQLVDEAGLGLVYDDAARAYRSLTRGADTTGLASRIGNRLAESRSSRSFLALGVDGQHLDLAVEVLVHGYDAVPVNLTQVLVEAMRQAAEQVGLPWDAVRADAAAAEAASRSSWSAPTSRSAARWRTNTLAPLTGAAPIRSSVSGRDSSSASGEIFVRRRAVVTSKKGAQRRLLGASERRPRRSWKRAAATTLLGDGRRVT